MARDIQLGLGDPPDRLWLFVGQDEGESSSCWYQIDHEKNSAKIPVTLRALTGYITGLRVVEKKFRGESKFKLDILMDAGRPYGIRSGMTTIFARGVILSLSAIEDEQDLRGALTIVVSPSKDNAKIVFGSVYLATRGTRVKYEWHKDVALNPFIQNLQSVLGDAGQSDEVVEHGEEESSNGASTTTSLTGSTVLDQVRAQAVRVGFTLDGTKNLNAAQLDEFVGKRYGGQAVNQLNQRESIDLLKLLREM